ncbi:MAG: glycine betaine ABC transporter substrate-binding protein [Bacillota bacterium]
MKKVLSLVAVLTLVFSLAACGGGDDGEFAENPEIVGIESGAGIMSATDTAIETYDLEMELLTSSGPAMVSALGDAIENEEWIVVTGWSPHYKFAEYDLKYLEDPEGVYGDVENIHTVARKNLSSDDPELTTFLENFYMSDMELGGLMGDIAASDDDAIEVARAWAADNEDVWSEWMPSGLDGSGEELEIAYVNWAEGVAMTHLVQALLEDEAGYTVELTMADAGPIFSGVADGSIDFFLDAWLPVTHAAYEEDYGDDYEDLGYNYEGARIGLVVPEYVEVDSIDELNDYIN